MWVATTTSSRAIGRDITEKKDPAEWGIAGLEFLGQLDREQLVDHAGASRPPRRPARAPLRHDFGTRPGRPVDSIPAGARSRSLANFAGDAPASNGWHTYVFVSMSSRRSISLEKHTYEDVSMPPVMFSLASREKRSTVVHRSARPSGPITITRVRHVVRTPSFSVSPDFSSMKGMPWRRRPKKSGGGAPNGSGRLGIPGGI